MDAAKAVSQFGSRKKDQELLTSIVHGLTGETKIPDPRPGIRFCQWRQAIYQYLSETLSIQVS